MTDMWPVANLYNGDERTMLWKLIMGAEIDGTYQSIIIWVRPKLCESLGLLLVIDIKVIDLQMRLGSGTLYCSDYLSRKV